MSENLRMELNDFLRLLKEIDDHLDLGDALPWQLQDLILNLMSDYKDILTHHGIIDEELKEIC